MKISVAVITYNQQDTIHQTIDSILMQKGDFQLELVLGEDCGSDNTLEICKEYERNYPKTVKVLNNTHNLGIMANYARTILACTGDYVADIAGDDYYCDDHALEKQINYLNANPQIGVIASNGYRYYVRRKKLVEGLNPTITLENDIAKEYYFTPKYNGGVYLRPIGMMIRRELFQHINFNEIIRRNLPVEDYPIQAILSQYTRFACLPDLLVTYRIYKESATFLSINHPKYLEYHKGLINTRRYLNELFPDEAYFSEKEMQEYLFYKEFLLYLHKLNIKAARLLLKSSKNEIEDRPKFKQAEKFTKNRIRFYLFHLYKEFVRINDIRHNT